MVERLSKKFWMVLVSTAIAIAVVSCAAIHVVVSTHLLRKWVNSDPEELLLDYDTASSWIPGEIRIRGLRMRGSDPNVQWFFRMEKATISIALLDLLHKQFHATRVRAEGLVFRLREKQKKTELSAAHVARLPSIPGFSDPPLTSPRKEPPPLSEREKRRFWSVQVENLVADPTVDGTSWQLTVEGEVEHAFTLNYQELMALPTQVQYESLMCISNDVGGPYMSNAQWEGIPLASLLQRAGVKTGATKIVFHAVDDYSDSIHLSKALEPTTLLAVRMNGVTLPQGHGFPARMLVPGIYGMKHCKWLNRIEVVNYNFQGYWQQRGWDDAAPVRMTSRIDTPLDGSNVKLNRTTYIAGVAFSGNKGISEVDVSLDSGQTWQPAILKHPQSDLTWVIWEYTWKPTSAANVIITVRAIDLEGNVQDPNQAPPLPIGSSGYHSITAIVS